MTWLTGNDRIIYFTVIFIVSSWIFLRDSRYSIIELSLITAAIGGLMLVRVCLLYHITWDYKDFLNPWVEEMRGLNFREAISNYSGNYNLPYMYLLFFISRYAGYDLMIIKAVSSFFDVILAYYFMKCVSLKYSGKNIQAASFILVLALPTVFLNSADWGQCDSIYASFCFAMLYYALGDQSRRAVISWTFAFAFKLQAVFVLPVFIILTVLRKIKVKDWLFIPITYFIIMIPALLGGRGLYSCISVYFDQVKDAPSLSVGAQNIWLLIDNVSFDIYNVIAIYLAGAAVVFFLYACITHLDRMNTENIIHAFLCITLLIPFLLPRMHDRYFYLADIASLLFFIYNRKKIYVPILQIYASFNTYRNYLTSVHFGNDKYISFIILLLIAKVLNDFFLSIASSDYNSCPFFQNDRGMEEQS
ncbi:MAG: hypothetical protein Q4F31_07230 [Eubacteriales bacterium]|nr:hypothetical protein [Eubacteriales bacterium]